MKLFTFKSIKTRLLFWFLFLSLAPLVVGFIITYYQQKESFKQESIQKLTAIRDLKVQELDRWISERVGDLNVMSGDFEIRGIEYEIGKDNLSPADIEKLAIARQLLNRTQRNYGDYEEIFIIGAKSGYVELSSNVNFEGDDKSHDSYFTVPMETGEFYIKNIYYSKTMNTPQMTFSLPIYCIEHNKHIIGILVARINLENSLYKLLLNRVGLGETGETLIINEDVVALNELRYYERAPLNLIISAEPAVLASQGKTGVTVTKDYRGEEILAAYTYIPQTGWGFVCKQDVYELGAPLRAFFMNIIILFIITVLLIIIIVFWIIKRISKPIVEMDVATQSIKRGDYTVRTNVKTKDELATLSDSINEMTESIETHITKQKAVVSISEIMIGQSSMNRFATDLLKTLMEITDANMSAFYILDDLTSEYVHFNSIGTNKELLKPFSADNPEGEFGNVLSQKEIYYLRDIPENTKFSYKTTAGDAVPKEMITIPIIADNIVVAIISLININKFETECYDIISQSWISINSSFSSLMASERTTVLAEHLSNTNQQLEAQTEELQDQAEELQSQTEELIDQTEELKSTSRELEDQNIELEVQKSQIKVANKLKSEFLSNMSHELRTPLNSIMALSRVLIMQAGDKLNDEENSYLEIVERNGKRLLALINDILDLSKIEAGKMEVFIDNISISILAETVKESMHAIATEKGISLSMEIHDNLPKVDTDESKLHHILTNIIGNAIKFTEEGRVNISMSLDSENVLINIEDTGIGIAKSELPNIFDEFRQVDGSSSRKYEGTGLGLAIAYKMVHILGGNITAKSTLGEGSIFTISIPISWKGNVEENDIPLSEIIDDKTDKDLILIIDDDPEIIEQISDYLINEGYRTMSATSGIEALKLAKKHHPFAITIDIIMPEMDGWELLQKLKTNTITSDIPVIVISVSDDQDTGFALGAIGFINKPVKKSLLLAEIYSLHSKPSSIMIVDDSEIDRNHTANIINNEHVNVIKIESGKKCIKLLETSVPDILILDLMMPEMDGFEVLDSIRKRPETKHLPVIIATAKDLTKDDKGKLEGKISAVIEKSNLSSGELLKNINRLLENVKKGESRSISNKNKGEYRILMVEDNQDAIVQVKAVLEKEGYIIDVAMGGQQALDYIKHTKPDGIILDLMMPDIDGFEVLEKLRSTNVTNNIPVLILTAKDLDRNDLSKLSANNIQQLILKGDIDIEGLLIKVMLMLGINPDKKNTDQNVKGQTLKQQEADSILPNFNIIGVKPKILVIEDNPDNMITIKAILKDQYSITEAVDGEKGLEAAQSQPPDLILLDMTLPKISGEDLIKFFKQDIITSNIPIIAVTAQSMSGDKEKFIALGCNGYVSKPIDSNILILEINRLLRIV